VTHLRIVAVGASAGGLETLLKLSRMLPASFPAAVCMVLHLPPLRSSALPALLGRSNRMPAAYGVDGEKIEAGRIYVAPPDRHLLVEDHRIRLGIGPRENGSRPAIDPLFRSVAQASGPNAIGVVLSGALYDGTSGLLAIKARGGIAIVQDPQEAVCSSMPRSALENVGADHVVRSDELAALLESLVASPPAPSTLLRGPSPLVLEHDIEIARDGVRDETPALQTLGSPSAFACPDCHGVLWEIKEGDTIRFRCRVGHAYLPDALAHAQSDELEEALWTALRSLRESAALGARLANNARQRNLPMVAKAHQGRADEALERAQVIEAVLKKGELAATERGAEANVERAGGSNRAERSES
jgi:two-component system chemotaxis response regulator CheB